LRLYPQLQKNSEPCVTILYLFRRRRLQIVGDAFVVARRRHFETRPRQAAIIGACEGSSSP